MERSDLVDRRTGWRLDHGPPSTTPSLPTIDGAPMTIDAERLAGRANSGHTTPTDTIRTEGQTPWTSD
jgi:hypothetical protein